MLCSIRKDATTAAAAGKVVFIFGLRVEERAKGGGGASLLMAVFVNTPFSRSGWLPSTWLVYIIHYLNHREALYGFWCLLHLYNTNFLLVPSLIWLQHRNMQHSGPPTKIHMLREKKKKESIRYKLTEKADNSTPPASRQKIPHQTNRHKTSPRAEPTKGKNQTKK